MGKLTAFSINVIHFSLFFSSLGKSWKHYWVVVYFAVGANENAKIIFPIFSCSPLHTFIHLELHEIIEQREKMSVNMNYELVRMSCPEVGYSQQESHEYLSILT